MGLSHNIKNLLPRSSSGNLFLASFHAQILVKTHLLERSPSLTYRVSFRCPSPT